MFIAEPILFMIMAAVFYVIWVWKNKPLRVVSYFGRIVFLLSCIIFITYYFLPLPLDAYAFRIYMDPLLPLNEAIKINPVAQIIESKRHLDYYFANLLPLIGGATLFGFSMDLLFDRPLPLRKHWLCAFFTPFGFFLFHTAFRLLTGYKWKIADSGQILWFMLFYFLGYGFCLITEKIRCGNQTK